MMSANNRAPHQQDTQSCHSYDVVTSEILAESPIFVVRRDTVTMPGGTTAKRDVLEHFGAVAVVAERDGCIAVIRQYRHALGTHLWELPAGLLDMGAENPVDAAARELYEEVGLRAEQWELLVDVASAPGYCDEVVRVYRARYITEHGAPEAHDEEAEIELRWVTLDEAVRMVMHGEIVNSTAIAGIMAAHYYADHPEEHAREAQTPFDYRPYKLVNRR